MLFGNHLTQMGSTSVRSPLFDTGALHGGHDPVSLRDTWSDYVIRYVSQLCNVRVVQTC